MKKRRISRIFRTRPARFEIEPAGFEYRNRTAQDHSRVEPLSTLKYTRGRQLEPGGRSVNLIVISGGISSFLWLPSTRNAPETTNKAARPRHPSFSFEPSGRRIGRRISFHRPYIHRGHSLKPNIPDLNGAAASDIQ